MARKKRSVNEAAEGEEDGNLANGAGEMPEVSSEDVSKETDRLIGNGEKVKKVRMAYYLVIGLTPDGSPVEVFKQARSQRSAEKWIIENKTLLARLTGQVIMVRARNVAVRQPQ